MRHILMNARQLHCFAIFVFAACIAIVSVAIEKRCFAQTPSTTAEAPPSAETFKLSTQGEAPLSDFVDYVSQRCGIRFLYDASIREKKINLVAPDAVRVENLMDILQAVLINEGLVISDSDEQGFRRITTSDQIPYVARPSHATEDISDVSAAVPLTRVFVLGDSLPSKTIDLIKPLLSGQGSSIVPFDRERLLVVTDIAKNIRRTEQMIQLLDGKQTQVDISFVQAQNVDVQDLADQLRSVLQSRQKAMGRGETATGSLEVSSDARTNSVILIGIAAEIEYAREILAKMDSGLEVEQQTFRLKFFSAESFDELIRESLQSRDVKPPYQSQAEGDTLIVGSTPEVLEFVERTRIELDTREAPESQSPVRFYKIKNVPAQELAETIRGIGVNGTERLRDDSTADRRRTTNDAAVPGRNLSPLDFAGQVQPVREPLPPPAFRPELGSDQQGDAAVRTDGQNAFTRGFPADLTSGQPAPESLVGDAMITVDIHTNTIIVVADPSVQRIYATLIETLDQRRPQVLIEARVVIIDTSDNYALGVEVSGGDRSGAKRLFSFSSFGLSTVDPVSGALAILPGVGFNGTLVDPDTADVVVRALANHRRARVLSAPRILVNDNAEGTLTSVLEVPFTSVNASQTVATTSFAGFAEAGTAITVTPTISDDNYLQVDYVVTLNSFTGTGSDGVPPPRQTNEVRSRVTVPDGHTMIVGGLTSKNASYEIDSIPWLERIPIVRALASNQSDNWQQTSLFVFLKPIILREDKFKDLRFLSDIDLTSAEEPTNFPVNQALLLE